MEKILAAPRFWIILICTLCLTSFAIRISAPTDLEGYAQMLNVGYIMDMMWQGNWIVQHNVETVIMSKPPLHSWLIAPFAALLGINRLSLALPSLLSVAALGLLVFEIGRRRFDVFAGGCAALSMVLAAPMMGKQIALVRADALFTLCIAISAFAAFHAWQHGKGWTLFWFAAALATLTKGPLGLVLAAAGLICYFWEKRSDQSTPPLRGAHLPGILLFLGITLTWLFLALHSFGDELIDKLFREELVGQAIGERKRGFALRKLLMPTVFLFARFLPFSIFFYGLWRVFRHPAAHPLERRFERFLTCWLLGGLLIFSLAQHQRPDLLLPLWPAAALLAGRELARLGERFGRARIASALALVGTLLLGVLFLRTHQIWGEGGENTRYAEEVKQAAAALAASGIDTGKLYHVDTPATLQMYLHTFRPWVKPGELEQALSSTTGPLDIALGPSNFDDLGLAGRYPLSKQIFRWPADVAAKPVIHIYRIRP